MEGGGQGSRFWSLREAPLLQGGLSFAVETLEKAGCLRPPAHSARRLRGAWGPLHHARAPPRRLLAPSWAASEFSTGGVGRAFSGQGSTVGSVRSVLAAPPGGQGQAPGLLLQQVEVKTLAVCHSWPEEGEEGRPEWFKRGSFTPLCPFWLSFCFS